MRHARRLALEVETENNLPVGAGARPEKRVVGEAGNAI
jgi:hypothetical protein